MAPGNNLAVDAGGSTLWLFRQGELILGPLPAAQLIEKLYEGELTGLTEVSRPGEGRFQRLQDVDYFKVHLAKAEAKWRVDAGAKTDAKRQSAKRRVKVMAGGLVVLGIVASAVVAAQKLAVHMPWGEDGFEFEVSAVEIKLARGRTSEELIAYPGGPVPEPRKRGGSSAGSGSGSAAATEKTGSGSKPGGGAVAARLPQDTRKPTLSDPTSDPDGMQTASHDTESINKVVAANQSSLKACLREEAQKRPGQGFKVPIEFVIGNNGRVSKLWIDNPGLKDGHLHACLLKELQKWPFKSYTGEQATVSLSFSIAGR